MPLTREMLRIIVNNSGNDFGNDRIFGVLEEIFFDLLCVGDMLDMRNSRSIEIEPKNSNITTHVFA